MIKIKDLGMGWGRLSWLIWVSPSSSHKSLKEEASFLVVVKDRSCFTFLWINFRNSHSLLESQIGIKIKIHYLIHYFIFGIFKGSGNHKIK